MEKMTIEEYAHSLKSKGFVIDRQFENYSQERQEVIGVLAYIQDDPQSKVVLRSFSEIKTQGETKLDVQGGQAVRDDHLRAIFNLVKAFPSLIPE
jgi:hypothetical protein